MKDFRCIDCGKTPEELSEYRSAARENGTTPEKYVETEEGTYNPTNGHFLCTKDFLKREFAGARLVGVNGSSWVAP